MNNRTRVVARFARWSLTIGLPMLLGCGDWEGKGPDWQWPHPAQHTPPGEPPCDPERDRHAIAKMAGTFEVSFYFEETDALEPGYTLREPYQTYGTEVVNIVDESAEKVSLQHVLLIDLGDGTLYPLKHWRQDWVFEDQALYAYEGRDTWRHQKLAGDAVRCTWSQAVYQVDDGPRYESYGQFQHEASTSTWTSGETYRPLPRRESARSSEYDVLLAVNMHVIDDAGWVHEEDNLKWRLDTQSALVRERGRNIYRRVELPLADIAHDHLAWTEPFWSDARSEWSALLEQAPAAKISEVVAGVARYDVLLPLAEELADAEPLARQAAIRDAIAPYVELLDQ